MLANELGRRGVSAVLIDEKEGTAFNPRANATQAPRSLPLRPFGRIGAIIIVFFAELAQTSYFYLTAIFTISFATRQLGVAKDVVTQAVLLANALALVVTPVIGAWSNFVGRKRLFVAGVALAATSMFAFYNVLPTRDAWLVSVAVILAVGIIHPLMFSTEGSYFRELFSPRVRFTGVSIDKQFGTVLGGGIAPLVATSLFAGTGTTFAITVYYVVLALAALIALSFAHETAKSGLPG